MAACGNSPKRRTAPRKNVARAPPARHLDPMVKRSFGRLVLASLCGVALAKAQPAAPTPAAIPVAPANDVPRLAVIISVDQLRADLVLRFRHVYGPGGFARLLNDGADYRETRYLHATTKTAPGHATIATGVPSAVHGIFSNEWVTDLANRRYSAAVQDPEAPLVGLDRAVRSPGGVIERDAGRSPRKLLAPTVGDQLKLRYGTRSRVIGIAGKDRSAILLGGHLADAAYWIEDGRFVSSTYYLTALPAWAQSFNDEKRVDQIFGSTWDRALPVELYDRTQGPDEAPGETTAAYGLSATFPKKLDGGHPQISPDFYEAFDCSPAALDLVTDFAITALRSEKLGTRADPDLLAISYSQPDLAGHLYGPDSHEMMDSIVRLDRALAKLFIALDREVGVNRWIAVLSADHGAAPLPERIQAMDNRIPAGRLDSRRLDTTVAAALDRAFGPAPEGLAWFVRDNNGYRLFPDTLAARRLEPEAVRAVVRDAIRTAPEIGGAWTRAEILGFPWDGETVESYVRRGYPEGRGQDVVFVTKPYFIDRSKAGTTHGMPYDYDQHVPQLWFGRGVKPGVHLERVHVEDIAPTLAGQLGINPPPEARGRRLF